MKKVFIERYARKDGKYKAQYVFTTSGKRINKLLTESQVTEEMDKDDIEVFIASKIGKKGAEGDITHITR